MLGSLLSEYGSGWQQSALRVKHLIMRSGCAEANVGTFWHHGYVNISLVSEICVKYYSMHINTGLAVGCSGWIRLLTNNGPGVNDPNDQYLVRRGLESRTWLLRWIRSPYKEGLYTQRDVMPQCLWLSHQRRDTTMCAAICHDFRAEKVKPVWIRRARHMITAKRS